MFTNADAAIAYEDSLKAPIVEPPCYSAGCMFEIVDAFVEDEVDQVLIQCSVCGHTDMMTWDEWENGI